MMKYVVPMQLYGFFRVSPPNHPFQIGFSMIFTIHFAGFPPIFGNTTHIGIKINHYEDPLCTIPRTPRVDFRWFLNHQNGWCDLRLGSDAAIRSWLCLGHPVVSPPAGPPLVIGVGWKWNKGKKIALKSFSMGIYRKRGDFPWLYVGLPEVNCWKKSVFTEFHLGFFA